MKTVSVQLEIMHSPRLATVLMVEETLKKAGEVIKVSELKRRLPRKVMHGTLLQILNYLQQSGKIIITTKGVLWIYTPRNELDGLAKSGLKL
jgi:hypothetical protein